MADLPWWGWVIFALVLVILFLRTAIGRFRRQVREEFLDLLRGELADVEIVQISTRSVRFRTGCNATGEFFFARLYSAIAELGTDDKQLRAPVYRAFLEELCDDFA